jgi:glycosyltransferase involved in cell wall biosynthesis
VKIAYVITRSDSIGGAQVHVRDLALTAQREGHEATVLVGGVGEFTEDLSQRGVSWTSLPHLGRTIHAADDLRGLYQIRSALRALRPDLVSTHSSKAGALGRLAARSLGIPVIFTAHGWAFAPGVPRWKRTIYQVAERLAASLSDRIIAVSHFDRELAVKARVAPAGKVVTVHNGIPDLDASFRSMPESAPVRLVMVARFEEQKDHAVLFEALAGLRHLTWQLDLIGQGPGLEAEQRRAAALGLAERVVFWGSRRDVAARLAQAQIFVLTSFYEGLPRSVLEAMRAGLPVVATAVGGVPELISEGETGFLVGMRDVEMLRQRLKLLITDPGLRKLLGSKARPRYEREFTLDRCFRDTMDVYREVVGAPALQPKRLSTPQTERPR